MAIFGKKAKLECQRGTTKVECLVSVYDRTDDDDGKPLRYRVVVQRLQDGVSMEDAEAGRADPMPFITNRKQWQFDAEGNGHIRYSHDDYVSAEMMEAIRAAATNVHESVATVETMPGVFEERKIEHYCVRLDIGFNLAKGEAFFYRIKSGVNKDSLAKDIKYNMRHMPAEGRRLTADIIRGHKDVTDVALRVYQDAMALQGGQAGKEAASDGKENDQK